MERDIQKDKEMADLLSLRKLGGITDTEINKDEVTKVLF